MQPTKMRHSFPSTAVYVNKIQYVRMCLCEGDLGKHYHHWSHLCLSLPSYRRSCHSDDLHGYQWALGKILTNPTKHAYNSCIGQKLERMLLTSYVYVAKLRTYIRKYFNVLWFIAESTHTQCPLIYDV